MECDIDYPSHRFERAYLYGDLIDQSEHVQEVLARRIRFPVTEVTMRVVEDVGVNLKRRNA